MNLPKIYDPAANEADMYKLWEDRAAFKPTGKGTAFTVVMPPPNANGNLHLGHALTGAIEDVAVRYNRLRGKDALLLPGADHAGFETQVVYEKQLAKEGKSRFDFTREELYSQIWDFVAQNRGTFESQVRRLGIGCDWSRFTFTLDEKIVNQAYATFRKMWEEGLIYRGERLVNFCTHHGTAFADIEVEHKEEQGSLWYIRYPLTDGTGEVIVATTRPETMLGDTGVAVHPDDARYHRFIGRTVRLPLTNREIPIVSDDFVDKDFGTGAVKLTPAHDPNDYDAAAKHDLPRMTVIDHEGKMTDLVPEAYRGLEVIEARKKIVADLKAADLLVKTENYTHNVGHCYKCGTIIQPLLREQWFVNMQPLAAEAIKALKANKVQFYPETKKTQLITYLEGLRDWNISRQIAWGIPIPAYQNVNDPDDWVFDENVSDELMTFEGKTYRRDPDVFDTWFSSSSWPYATLGYPDNPDYKHFYPLNLMETGFDILMPWVSRMLMLGLYVTGEVPFKSVYLHGLILDPEGQKMSKSKGNVVNPIEMIDTYGSDALRMGILSGQTPGNNQPFMEDKIVGARNFCNKLWNIARYIEDKTGDDHDAKHHAKPETAADHWLLSKLVSCTDTMASHLDNYRFSEAYETLYRFVRDDFADWYIEASKTSANTGLLAYTLESILKIAHPFAPFLTETIWQNLSREKDTLVATAKWPEIQKFDKSQASEFEEIKKIVSECRSIIKALQATEVTLYHNDDTFLNDNASLIKRLAGLQNVAEVSAGTGLHLVDTKYRCWLDIDEATARSYQKQLEDKRAAQEAVVNRLKGRLANKDYMHKAPHQVVEQTEAQLEEATNLLEQIDKEAKRYAVE